MAQYYSILKVSEQPPKTWEGKYGPMETYKVMLEGVDEPVEVNRKPGNKPKATDALYGEVNSTEFGYKFKSESKPYGGQGGQAKSGYTRDDAAIQAQWSINQAREYIQFMLGKDAKLTEIFDTAKLFYKMIDQVKNSTETPQSGIELARAKADELRTNPGQAVEANNSEEAFANQMTKAIDDGTEIDLSEIPF